MTTRAEHYQTRFRLDLTPRQRQVLSLIERGKTNYEIAQSLGVSLDGAKYHVSEILSKLQVGSREDAVTAWQQYNRPGARLQRLLQGLAAFPWARAVLGAGVVASFAALAVLVVVMARSLDSGNTPDQAAAAQPAATTESTIDSSTPVSAAVPGGGQAAPGSTATGDAPASIPSTPPAAQPQLAVCLQHQSFSGNGPVPLAAQPAGTSTAVADLRFAAHQGCERVVIELDSSSPGDVSVEFLRDLGVVRVHLDDTVTSTGEADASFGGALASAAYVVRAADRSLYVDVHLGAPAVAAAQVLDSPARVVIDLKAGGPALPSQPARDVRVVVLDPPEGVAAYPLAVTGYSRSFEANVVLRLLRESAILFQTNTTAADYSETWGEFSFSVPSGPIGDFALFVGELSARDGTEEGLRFPIILVR